MPFICMSADSKVVIKHLFVKEFIFNFEHAKQILGILTLISEQVLFDEDTYCIVSQFTYWLTKGQ